MINKFNYDCSIDKEIILKAIENHECYDSWGEVEYGDDTRAVDYNICIDGTDESDWEYVGAFYRLYLGDDGYWHHDNCCEYYQYDIDFNDENWEEKLKETSKKAFEELWN